LVRRGIERFLTDEKMVLDRKRKNIDPILTKVAKRFINVNPNLLSIFSLGAAFFAGVFFYFSSPQFELINYYLYIAVLFVFINGFLDAIDGKVAKLAKKESLKGDFIDHAIDRYADVFIVAGIALSPWCRYNSIGLFAIIGMLLTSYMGTQAQAIGYKREYSGLLGRADRLALLMIIPIIQHILIIYNIIEIDLFFYSLNLLEIVLIYFAIVGNITAIQRILSVLKFFKNDKKR
jgi:archaetidylinositol phosphate synthase